jgi:hypothetical protein
MDTCYCTFSSGRDLQFFNASNLRRVLKNEDFHDPCIQVLDWAARYFFTVLSPGGDSSKHFLQFVSRISPQPVDAITLRTFDIYYVSQNTREVIKALMMKYRRERRGNSLLVGDLFKSPPTDGMSDEQVLNMLWKMLAQAAGSLGTRHGVQKDLSYVPILVGNKPMLPYHLVRKSEPDIWKLELNKEDTDIFRFRFENATVKFSEMYFDASLLCESDTHLFGDSVREAVRLSEDFRRNEEEDTEFDLLSLEVLDT